VDGEVGGSGAGATVEDLKDVNLGLLVGVSAPGCLFSCCDGELSFEPGLAPTLGLPLPAPMSWTGSVLVGEDGLLENDSRLKRAGLGGRE
jgi:hypothetical protein